MDEWVFRAIIGVAGVAVGAILGPWVEHRLARRAVRGRQQREMMEAWLAMTRQKWAHFLAAIMRIQEGRSVKEAATDSIGALKNWMDGNEMVTRYPWEPERVLDKELRGLFEELSSVMTHMLLYTLDVAGSGKGRRDVFIETINGDVGKAETLRKRIIERMDKADL